MRDEGETVRAIAPMRCEIWFLLKDCERRVGAAAAWRRRLCRLLEMPAVLFILVATASSAAADAGFKSFLAGLRDEALAAGVTARTFDAVVPELKPDYSLPDLVLPGAQRPKKVRQAEFTRAPGDYLDARYLARLGNSGRKLARKHAKALDDIEARFGVDRAIVMAIWGRETSFGRYTPKHDAIRVLATQAYVGRRKEMFRTEFFYALKLLDKGVPRKKMRASWAGAMGLTQFMPSEFFTHAADTGGDGYADLFDSVPDALASAARQLKNKGWISGLDWGYEIAIPEGADCAMEGPAGERPFAEWQRLGFKRVAGRKFPAAIAQQNAYLMSPAGAHGPSFLVSDNFKVIRAYNTSDLYATFVANLADRIRGGGNFVTPWKPIGPQKTKIIRATQQGLQDAGYPIRIIDGFIGSNTRRQVGQFQRNAGMRVDCWPSQRVVDKLARSSSQ